MKSLELFAGAGGLSLGLHQAGFNHLALVEWDHNAAMTLKENAESLLHISPDRVFHSDARGIDYSHFNGKVDLLAGGPPCQPFSNAGKNQGSKDHRDMFPIFLDVVKIVNPKAIFIENVKGLLREKFSDYFEYITRRLMFPTARLKMIDYHKDLKKLRSLSYDDFPRSNTYKITYQMVNTADYGVPQRRERVIITGFRNDLEIDPMHIRPTHSKEALLVDQFITGEYWKRHGIRSATGHLGMHDKRILQSLAQGSLRLPYSEEKLKLRPWRTVRDTIGEMPKPVKRGKEPSITNHVQHPGARVYVGHIGSYYDYPAKALKAGTHGTPGGENILRIGVGDRVRYFTTREAGRLHTFPDDWVFLGPWGSCIRHVGNAVPVLLAKKFGEYIYQELKRTSS